MEKQRTSHVEHRTTDEAVVLAPRSPGGVADDRAFELEERLLEFASVLIDLCEKLPSTRVGRHIAAQLLRSGTSPYASHSQAEAPESSDDLIRKLGVCLQDLRESRRWLRLTYHKNWLPVDPQLNWALVEVDELIHLSVASIRKARHN